MFGVGKILLDRGELLPDAQPSFRSGDIWLVELPNAKITARRVRIKPADGAIKVTLLHGSNRREFCMVKRWLLKIEV